MTCNSCEVKCMWFAVNGIKHANPLVAYASTSQVLQPISSDFFDTWWQQTKL